MVSKARIAIRKIKAGMMLARNATKKKGAHDIVHRTLGFGQMIPVERIEERRTIAAELRTGKVALVRKHKGVIDRHICIGQKPHTNIALHICSQESGRTSILKGEKKESESNG